MWRALGLLLLTGALMAAEATWPQGKRFAVSLTYDDGIESQILNGAFALDQRGLKATFFPTGASGSVAANPKAWSALIAKGHELGSHSMLHPCGGSAGGFLPPQNRLEAYDAARLGKELDDSLGFLKGLGWKNPVTYAWPCGQDWFGPDKEDATPLVAKRFTAARSVLDAVADPASVDLLHVPAIDGARSLVSLQGWVEQAKKKGAWLVVVFHGVGGDYLAVDGGVHEAFLDSLAADAEAWVAPFGNVAARVAQKQKKR